MTTYKPYDPWSISFNPTADALYKAQIGDVGYPFEVDAREARFRGLLSFRVYVIPDVWNVMRRHKMRKRLQELGYQFEEDHGAFIFWDPVNLFGLPELPEIEINDDDIPIAIG